MPYRDPDAHRNAANAYVLERSRNQRDIARGYPDAGDLATREACSRDLKRFYSTYFPNAFNRPWCADHLKAIELLERVTFEGGMFAFAMPRSWGKTALSVRAAIWALLYGHRRYVCLIGATKKLAGDLLDAIKVELTFNEKLGRDFRQVCYPLKRLENNGRKRIGQLFNGEQTGIEWSDAELTFPFMPPEALDGPDVGGSVVMVASLDSAVRGQNRTLRDGTILRPELVILDDPQTRESAGSVKQNADRAATINGDVLGLAGPDRRIAAIMPCTVIYEDDLASEYLDRKKKPQWSGQRTRAVYSFPTDQGWWDHYAEVRNAGEESGGGPAMATALYASERAIADAGAVVAWPDRYYPDELSAVQFVMNLRIDLGPAAFDAEYQNQPHAVAEATGFELKPEQILAKFNRVRRGTVPQECDRVTAMIDVQQDALYYLVAAWEAGFGGSIVDYGAFPDPKRSYFSLRDLKGGLAGLYPSAGLEGRLYAGLETLTDSLLTREWRRVDGTAMKIGRCLIDSGKWTDTILKFCRESAHAAIITPSKGMGLRPADKPFSDYRKEPGGTLGFHWRIPGSPGRGSVRAVHMDVNYWKSFLRDRLGVSRGDRGCLSLFGDEKTSHRMLADHLTAESCDVLTSDRAGRRLDVWTLRPNRENHLLDCLVGACVAASMQGCALAETIATAPSAKRQRVSFKDLQNRRQGPGQARP